MSKERITLKVANQLLVKYRTPKHVVAHCKAVAEAALKLTRALNRAGLRNLDEDLVYGAALIHDIARVTSDHEKEGAAIARRYGYEDEARIIEVHMHYRMHRKLDELDETDMVCFGDRVVKEDTYVGLDQRMDYVVNKVHDNPEAVNRIRQSQREIRTLLCEIENKLGVTIDQLMDEQEG